MSFQITRSLLTKVARPATRVAGRTVGRRAMSSAPGAQAKSDTPWIIGSALVFGPAAAYLLSPPAQKKAHEAEKAALPKHKTPDPEHAPVPPEAAETQSKQETSGVSDDEGNKASNEEVADAVNKASDEDAPKTAQYAEAETSKRADPETNEAAKGTGYDPSVAQKADTKQTEGSSAGETKDKGPQDVGGARERAKSGQDPNTSSQTDDKSGRADEKPSSEEKKESEKKSE
ncbi:hypothetical protein PsYK624_045670 [Phanerochaete sordida]|uniref:Uncharacterized protein n=1 Tax=Phanerochaete sordida TaxID=48140 RepID=A0A9P3G5Z2_9APHY|nr:hypothetical protein PsYK624_045670 [Phanerochaete sordida]